MTKDTSAHWAQQIACSLFELEKSLDQAIASLSALTLHAHSLKIEAGLTIFHGQDALEKSTQLAVQLSAARRTTGELHRKLELSQFQIGLETVDFGAVGKPPAPDHVEMSNVTQMPRAS